MREVSIAADPTVSEGHAAKPHDPQASLRTELLGQLVAAQFDLEAAIADLTRDGAPASAILDSRNQLGGVLALRQKVAAAGVGSLASMRSEIAAMVASSQSAAQQTRTAGDTANASNISNLAQNTRTAVNDAMRGMKDFEPYLHFTNAQDEADYRRREDERRSYIAAEQANGTPLGDLNAGGAAVGQMTDAAAHGAAQSPEFQQRWQKLTASTDALRSQLIREGKDVSPFDAHLREDLRGIMRAKGVPDAKIGALLAAHRDNPLDAAKEFVAEQKGVIGEKEITDISRKALEYKDGTGEPPLAEQSVAASSPTVDAMAQFKASGVMVAESGPEQPTHGVATKTPAVAASTRSI